MDRATRKELKSDKFALEIQHGVEYVSEHRKALVRWGIVGAVVLVAAIAIFLYVRHQSSVRAKDLEVAMRNENASIGPPQTEYTVAFPTVEAKEKAATKAWSDLAAKYPGSDAGIIAEYFLASHAADAGNIAEAQKKFQLVVDSGNKDYSSLAKLALAQLDASQEKLDEAKKLMQSLIDNPTAMVSKEAATIALAHLIAPADPQGARKLLEPLRGSDRPQISKAALTALSELPK